MKVLVLKRFDWLVCLSARFGDKKEKTLIFNSEDSFW